MSGTTLRVSLKVPGVEFDVYCGRAESTPPEWTGEGADGYFGNYSYSIHTYERYFHRKLEDTEFKRRVLALRGRRLACFCGIGEACHVDHIIGWLDEEEARENGVDLLESGFLRLIGV